jgi:hypothetical protein
MLIRRGVALVHLVLSLDYEVFGNGAGDVVRDVVYPTSRLLDICERHGAKMTIMFEVGEYWAFERHDDQLREDLGYSPCEAMKTQVIEAIERGHDVQLHLHPQWIGATYDKGAWQLQNRYWRLADLPDGLGSKDQTTSITGALHAGKQTLERMIKPGKADYGCVCFRAGGFYAQPSPHVITGMKQAGLRVDSSVVKGYRIDMPFQVDYSNIGTDKPVWWTTDTELVAEGKPGENILELPVSSRMEPYWNSFQPAKLRAAIRRRQIERASHNGCAKGNGNGISSVPSYRAVLKKMLTKHASTFDFCKLSCKHMLQRIQELDDRRQQPVVMIGHSKDFVNDRQFDEFLAALARSKSVRFVSMSESIEEALCVPSISKSTEIVDTDSGRLETQ